MLFNLHVHQAARALARHELEVRRVAANHRAQHDDAVVVVRLGNQRGRQRQFEGTRHAMLDDALGRHAPLQQAFARAFDQGINNFNVPARCDQCNLHVVKFAVFRAGGCVVSGFHHGKAPLPRVGGGCQISVASHVFNDFKVEAREALKSLWRREYAHLPHPEVGQNLCPDAVGPQHLGLVGDGVVFFKLRLVE